MSPSRGYRTQVGGHKGYWPQVAGNHYQDTGPRMEVTITRILDLGRRSPSPGYQTQVGGHHQQDTEPRFEVTITRITDSGRRSPPPGYRTPEGFRHHQDTGLRWEVTITRITDSGRRAPSPGYRTYTLKWNVKLKNTYIYCILYVYANAFYTFQR